jgi:hypothetical protein
LKSFRVSEILFGQLGERENFPYIGLSNPRIAADYRFGPEALYSLLRRGEKVGIRIVGPCAVFR